MSAGVELRHVSKSFGVHTAVDDVSFDIPPGSFFSLLGPSGCGKSTTLRMLTGLEWPDLGEIRIDGQDVSRVPPNKRPTNMVFQRWALFPHMTVFDNVAFGLKAERRPTPEIAERVADALALVDLKDYVARKPGQLSGGQMQRVALARALVKRPKVLLLDEPLGALDLKLRTQMQIELKRIQREIGTTFIYVTHDQGEAMTMSDRIAIMNAGRIEQIGTPTEIYVRPATRFVAGFIGNTNFLDVDVAETTGEFARVKVGSLSFSARRADLTAGRHGVVAIRYERIRAGAAAAGLPTVVRGTVKDVVFSGSTVHVLVHLLEDALELTYEAPFDGRAPLPVRGMAVTIGWDEEAARLFVAP